MEMVRESGAGACIKSFGQRENDDRHRGLSLRFVSAVSIRTSNWRVAVLLPRVPRKTEA
jgi:hypothetical protein